MNFLCLSLFLAQPSYAAVGDRDFEDLDAERRGCRSGMQNEGAHDLRELAQKLGLDP